MGEAELEAGDRSSDAGEGVIGRDGQECRSVYRRSLDRTDPRR